MSIFRNMTKKQRKLLKRITIAFCAYILCLLIPDNYSIVRTILYIIPYLVAGYDVLRDALMGIIRGQVLDENFLMCIATVGAYALGDYSEAVMVMLLYQAGELFQSYAVSRSRKSIANLMDIRPDYANLICEDGSFKTVSPEKLCVEDKILIKAGERVPTDCIVISGISEVDTSSITGESIPRAVNEDDQILSGTINLNGTLTARVTKVYAESTVSKILEITEVCAERKSKSEKFITKFAKYYTPIVCMLALLVAVIPSIIFGTVFENIKKALIFLVISCPCALVISVPLSFFSGIGCASKNGILVKGAAFIEALSKADIAVFDKTGTLTKGEFKVSDITSVSGVNKDYILDIAIKAEYFSNHPIAIALKREKVDINTDDVKDCVQVIGKGIIAKIADKEIVVGNAKLMNEVGISFDVMQTQETVLYVAENGRYIGAITLSDMIKKEAKEALAKLKKLGFSRIVMLTGDKKDVGEYTANSLSIDKAYFELLPTDKVDIFEKILESNSNGKTLFVGDGINDAPVLTRADIGIAMGGIGSDAAIEAADIIIMDDNLCKLPLAVSIARKIMRIVKQNIVFAIGVKAIIMVLGAFEIANMWLAIFSDVGVSVIAILNSLRTFYIKK